LDSSYKTSSPGKSPAEAAGICFNFKRNTWLGLITLSAKIFIVVYIPKMKLNLFVFAL